MPEVAGAGETTAHRLRRVGLVTRIAAAGFAVEAWAAGPLWTANREYPRAPIASVFAVIGPHADKVFVVLLALTLAVCVVNPRPCGAALWALITVLVFGYAVDQARLYPSFYEYSLIFVVVAIADPQRGSDQAARRCIAGLAVLTGGVYLWSGIQKLNPDFGSACQQQFLPEAIRGSSAAAAICTSAPVLEAAAGIGLLLGPARRYALLFVAVMHVWTASRLGPFDSRASHCAWAWDLTSAAIVLSLFGSSRDQLGIRSSWGSPAVVVACVLVGVAPALSFVGIWDAPLSFNVYSGNETKGTLVLPVADVSRLQPEAASHAKIDEGSARIDLWEWSTAVFGAGPYAEVRALRAVLKDVCGRVSVPDGVRLVVRHRTTWLDQSHRIERFGCPPAE